MPAAAFDTDLTFHPAEAIRAELEVDAAPGLLDEVNPEALRESLRCAHLCFGFHGVAVVDVHRRELLMATGHMDQLQSAAEAVAGFWTRTHDGHRDVSLQQDTNLILTTAVPGRAGWWLLGVGALGQADLSQLRWQLRVAANSLAA